MPGFFKEINTAYGRLEFHFIGICCPEGYTFFASVRDPFQKAHVLELQQHGVEWRLASPGVPPWLQEAEGGLVAVVRAHVERSSKQNDSGDKPLATSCKQRTPTPGPPAS